MKKSILIGCTVLAIFCLTAFGYKNWNNNNNSVSIMKYNTKLPNLAHLFCSQRDIDPTILFTKSQKQNIVFIKKAFCALAYSQGFTQQDIADFLGYKDHTTVHHHIKDHVSLSESNKSYISILRASSAF